MQIAGKSFPIPLRLKEKLFYEPDTRDEVLRQLREAYPGRKFKKADLAKGKAVHTKISTLVASYQRNLSDNLLAKQFRQSAEGHLQLSPDEIICKTCEIEEMALQSREEAAEQNILTNLKSQKYG